MVTSDRDKGYREKSTMVENGVAAPLMESRGRSFGRVTLELRTDGPAGANSLGVRGVSVPATEITKAPPDGSMLSTLGRGRLGCMAPRGVGQGGRAMRRMRAPRAAVRRQDSGWGVTGSHRRSFSRSVRRYSTV